MEGKKKVGAAVGLLEEKDQAEPTKPARRESTLKWLVGLSYF